MKKKIITLIAIIFGYIIVGILKNIADTGNEVLDVFMVVIALGIMGVVPLSKIFSRYNVKIQDLLLNTYITLSILALIACIFFNDLFWLTAILTILMGVVIFIVVPTCYILMLFKKSHTSYVRDSYSENKYLRAMPEDTIFCPKCGKVLRELTGKCPNCNEEIDVNMVLNYNSVVKVFNFDPIFDNDEEKLLGEVIKRELIKAGINENIKQLPPKALARKNVMNIIFALLVFVYTILIFFHFPIYTYLIGFVILLIYFIITKKYNLIKYLKREVKSRPSEKISNIVMSNKDMLVKDSSILLQIITFVIAVVLPMIIFINPRIMYEKVESGYAVRFYTMGLTNMKKVVIPEEYKGEKVVSLRGNTFSNMWLLEEVNLPDSIIEIRGQAFKNCKKLKTVNIPNELQYLGGGAFYNAKSIKRIILPDTLEYLGGESFYNASSLEEVRLSNNLKEIRGNSFQNCTSLKKIVIPDSVTRIGGHAFHNDTNLSEVVIEENSNLKAIGSSAFRGCTKLLNIKVPYGISISERAFKETNTIIDYFDKNY